MWLYLALHLPWSVHGACMDHLFSTSLWHVFYSDITWTCTQASYKFPPAPPWALLMRMAGTMQRMSNAVWMGDNAMEWLVATGHLVAICKAAAHHVPHVPRTPHVPRIRPACAPHAPRPSCPMCPTRCVPCAPPIASHRPHHHVPHGHLVVSHTNVSLHASQPQRAARPC